MSSLWSSGFLKMHLLTFRDFWYTKLLANTLNCVNKMLQIPNNQARHWWYDWCFVVTTSRWSDNIHLIKIIHFRFLIFFTAKLLPRRYFKRITKGFSKKKTYFFWPHHASQGRALFSGFSRNMFSVNSYKIRQATLFVKLSSKERKICVQLFFPVQSMSCRKTENLQYQ